MRYEIDFVESALVQLRALPKDARRLIGAKLNRAQHDLAGDIKKTERLQEQIPSARWKLPCAL